MDFVGASPADDVTCVKENKITPCQRSWPEEKDSAIPKLLENIQSIIKLYISNIPINANNIRYF